MRFVLTMVVLAAASACTDGVDPSDLLAGQWGSSQAEFRASPSGSFLELSCSGVTIQDTIELEPDGTFEADGRFTSSMALVGEPPEATVIGLLRRNTLELVVQFKDKIAPMHFTLFSGGERPPDEACPT